MGPAKGEVTGEHVSVQAHSHGRTHKTGKHDWTDSREVGSALSTSEKPDRGQRLC